MKAHFIKPLEEYTDDWLYAAFLGCSKLGIEVVNCKTMKQLLKAPKGDLIFAHIDETIEYLNHIGVKVPSPIGIPEELLPYTKRTFGETTLGELLNHPENFTFPLFVKPKLNLKTIPEGVVSRPQDFPFTFKGYTHLVDEVITTSNKIEMLSEYRCFIHNGKIVGVQHYHGDFMLFPDANEIRSMVKKYTKSPCAYTLDVAVTDKGETVLVECNDAWSIGNYGLYGKTYVLMLRDRWRDILNGK
jgi:hypothetical protein